MSATTRYIESLLPENTECGRSDAERIPTIDDEIERCGKEISEATATGKSTELLEQRMEDLIDRKRQPAMMKYSDLLAWSKMTLEEKEAFREKREGELKRANDDLRKDHPLFRDEPEFWARVDAAGLRVTGDLRVLRKEGADFLETRSICHEAEARILKARRAARRRYLKALKSRESK